MTARKGQHPSLRAAIRRYIVSHPSPAEHGSGGRVEPCRRPPVAVLTRVSPELKRELVAIAKEHNRSVAGGTRHAIAEGRPIRPVPHSDQVNVEAVAAALLASVVWMSGFREGSKMPLIVLLGHTAERA